MLKSAILAGVSVFALAATSVAAKTPDRPMFKVGVGLRPNIHQPTALPTWTFSYKYQGTTYKDLFVGKAPKTGASVTIPVYIIPVKLTVGKFSTDPLGTLPNGKTVVANTIASPIFQPIDFKVNGIDFGTTQYEDAFQRSNLWDTVKTHPKYHVLLGQPTVEAEQSFTVPAGKGSVGTDFGVKVIQADINWFDSKIQPLLTSLKIPANALPIFITTQAYLTSGGCCIGGYHNYNGTQAYAHFTYIQSSGAFSQDVSALSHEVGEWLDDPETNNTDVPAACGQNGNAIYEVGDPLEGDTNYGGYPYTLGGFTYNLQDLTSPVYFGAPATTSANSSTFQGSTLAVCINGG